MKNKAFLLVLGAAAIGGTLAGCGKEEKTTTKSITVCLASEPQSIDPALNSAVDGATMLAHIESGLYRYQQNSSGKLVLTCDLAESITKATAKVVDHVENDEGKWVEQEYPNGTRYTVKLREGIKWSNGDAITADDFIYSWNRASSAKLAADYCYMFEPICDGVYNESSEECPGLAVKKVNDREFTIDLMVDVTYFDQLLAFPTYFPVHKATVEKYDTEEDGKWATEASTYVSCGAYTIKEWVHKSYIKVVKNPNFWDAANIKMEEITFALSDDDNAILASYRSGEYQLIDNVPNDQIADLKAAYPNEFIVAGQMGTYYVSFNVNSTTFKKADTEEKRQKVRKALGLFIDRQSIVNNITGSGEVPANAFVSAGLSDAAGGEFVDHNGEKRDGSGYFNKGATDAEYKANCEEAIQLLKDVGYTYNAETKKFTDVEAFKYLYNTNSRHEQIGKNFKDTWAAYGLSASLDSQEWATFLTNRKEGKFDVARNGWVADYDDPSSYLTMWTSNSGNNDCQFGKDAHATTAIYSADVNRDGTKETGLTWAESYDVLIELSNKEADATKRFAILHEAEDLLMSTGAICPVYFYTDLYMIKTNIKGFFSSPLGYKYFMYATVE